jgi:hypothetical protein
MTNEEKIGTIKQLLSQYVAERVNDIADGAVLRSVDAANGLDDFVKKWLEDYHGEDKVPWYVLKEFISYVEKIRKPYNVPYVREIAASNWEGEEPELLIGISADVHKFIGSFEVNVYALRGDSYEVVQCGVSIDDEKNVTIRTATAFTGRIEIFCSVGETPELQHEQPVYSVNGILPDEVGNVTIEALAAALLEAHNNDPEAHRALVEEIMTWG